MPKKVELSEAVIVSAQEAARKARTSDELRSALTVLIPCLLNAADRVTAKIIGRSRATVVRLRKKFRECCAGRSSEDRNWGGRRYGYMTIEQERQFLSQFFDLAARGGVLVVSEIKKAYEAEVGHEVAKTTIYRMLERHGWRKIMPRPRHPKSDTEAQEGFKKTPENSG
jgi:transposase